MTIKTHLINFIISYNPNMETTFLSRGVQNLPLGLNSTMNTNPPKPAQFEVLGIRRV
jgi:hypothetical protein